MPLLAQLQARNGELLATTYRHRMPGDVVIDFTRIGEPAVSGECCGSCG